MPIFAIRARIMSLALTPGFQRAIHAHRERLRRPLQQALRCEHVLHFAGSDAERQRSKCAVRRCVRIAADHRHARLRQSLLRPDHVNDPLPLARQTVACESRTRGNSFRAARPAPRRLGRQSASRAEWSASNDRWSRWSDPAAGLSTRAAAIRQTPAATSLRGPDADRCRSAPARPRAPRRRGCPRFSQQWFAVS